MSARQTLVIGDLHLCSTDDHGGGDALSLLVRREPGLDIVFAGDTLDLPAETTRDPADAARRALAASPSVVAALGEQVAHGATLTFVSGNHDGAIASLPVVETIRDVLGLTGGARDQIRASPWMVRLADGAVHIEHGHAFEPDGAPTHPLAPIARDDVGIVVLRDFIVPIGGHSLVHANAEPPMRLLARVLRRYGARAPAIVARYIAVACTTVAKSGRRFPLALDRAFAKGQLDDFAAEVDLDTATLAALHDAHATPTRARLSSTFLRLYLDRVFATMTMLGGATVASAATAMRVMSTLPRTGAFQTVALEVAFAGATALAASITLSGDRYGGRAQRALALGAERVADLTGARTVIFGHVHVPDDGPRYRNTGSFAFPSDERGRSYLRVGEDGRVERAFVRGP